MVTEIVVDDIFVKEMDELRQPDKTVGLIEACSKNIVVFAEFMLGMRLYAWQIKFLKDLQDLVEGKYPDKSEALAMTSRQIGKSTSLAVFSLWCAIFNKKPGTVHNDTIICMISRSDEQAKKLLDEVKKWYRYGDRFMRDKYKDSDGKSLFGAVIGGEYKGFFTLLLSKDAANNTTTITFQPYNPQKHGLLLKGSKTGSSIRCLPPTSKVLGFSFSIGIIDEAGHESITDSFFYNDLYPTGDSTDALWIYTSTPWDPARFFYEFVDLEEKNDTHYIMKSVFSIEALKNDPSTRAKNQYEKVQVKIKRLLANGKKDEVQRAYYCRFVKGENSYFDPKDVAEAFNTEYIQSDFLTSPCDLGVDFGGQVKSRTVLTVSELGKEDIVYRRHHKVYPVGKDNNLVDDIEQLKKRFNIQRIIVDDCPAGAPFISQMVEKGWDVHPMSFRSEKIKKYGAFRISLKKHKIKSYKDDDLKKEMYALEYTPGNRQSNIQHAPGYSDDLIDSFLMSTYFFIDDEEGVKFYEW